MLNPWKVQNIHEFNYYCCPECVFRSKEDMSFQAHALQNHVLSRSFFHGTKDTEDQSNLYRGIDNCSVLARFVVKVCVKTMDYSFITALVFQLESKNYLSNYDTI